MRDKARSDSLSPLGERVGVRGVPDYRWSCNPLTPALSPNGEREQTESVAALIASDRNVL